MRISEPIATINNAVLSSTIFPSDDLPGAPVPSEKKLFIDEHSSPFFVPHESGHCEIVDFLQPLLRLPESLCV